MKRLFSVLLLSISLLVPHLFSHSNAAAASGSGSGDFGWGMFLPAIIAGHQTQICSVDHLEKCTDINSCKAAGGHWYSNQCNKERHPNQIKTEKLAGAWTFTTKMDNGGNSWIDKYELNINSVKEDPTYPGEFLIFGTNSDLGSDVFAGYDPEYDDYFLYDQYDNSVDLIFFFIFTDTNRVSGENYELKNESTVVKSGPYSMSGQKTN